MVQWNNPRESVPFNITLRNVTFPQAGEYRFQVWARERLIIEKRLMLLKAKGGGK